MELPLQNQLSTLIDRAGRGDPAATCRLALSAIRCRHVAFTRRFEAGFQQNLERRPGVSDDSAIDHIARSMEDAGNYCDGVDASALPAIDSLPDLARRALTPSQKTLLAMTRADGTLRRLRQVPGTPYSQGSSYVLSQYIANNTHRFLIDGYNARIPLALEGLVILHAPGSLGAPQGIAVQLPDPNLFLKYATLYVQLFGPESLDRPTSALLDAVEASVPPVEAERISQDVERELKLWQRARGPQADGPTAPPEIDKQPFGCPELQ